MRVVGIGGGHGLSVTLAAARLYADEVAAVVTVADDGGSSGRLTRELGIPPPGDIRNCLVALSDEGDMAALYQHRFRSGALTGHTVGNLVIAALAESTGDFAAAVDEAGKLLGAHGRVYPATTMLVGLRARTRGGELRGQVAVGQSEAPIQSVHLDPPDPPAHGAAVRAIAVADQVVLGPGSLFTSVIATLLVPGIRDALAATGAERIFVCNARAQKGETQGLDAAAHLQAVRAHTVTNCIDRMIVQVPALGSDGVGVDVAELEGLGIEVLAADVALDSGTHDSGTLARALAGA